jgi:hypothetical protein
VSACAVPACPTSNWCLRCMGAIGFARDVLPALQAHRVERVPLAGEVAA